MLTLPTDTFALANLFQVLESSMGIIGACLPVMRQPLKQYFPRWFGSSGSTRQYESNDMFVDHYALQHTSERQQRYRKDGAWHNVSITGPEHARSRPRKSDELGIVGETVELENRDSSNEMDRESPRSRVEDAIRKDVVFSVDRR